VAVSHRVGYGVPGDVGHGATGGDVDGCHRDVVVELHGDAVEVEVVVEAVLEEHGAGEDHVAVGIVAAGGAGDAD